MPDGTDQNKGGRQRIDWDAIRADYEQKAVTNITELARIHGTSREVISRRIRHDVSAGKPWLKPEPSSKPPKSDNVVKFGEYVGRNLDRRMELRGRDRDQSGAKDVAKGADGSSDVVNDPSLHGVIAAELMAAVRDTIADYRAGNITPGINQSKADVLSSIGSTADKAVNMSRKTLGILPNEASGTKGTDDNAFEFTVDKEALAEARKLAG